MKIAALCAAATLLGCGTGPTPPNGQPDGGQPDAGALHAITLTGCPLDSYFAPVTIAGQPFTLLLDTGSTDTAVALPTCANCGVSPTLTAPSGSCSTTPDQSMLGWSGVVCSETMSVGGEVPDVTVNLVGINDSGSFFTNVDCTQQPIANGQPPHYQGIFGLGPIALATIGHEANDAYFNELVANGVNNQFALLLCSVGGRMWFGGYDPQFANGPPQFTPLSMPMGWQIAVSSIGLGSMNLGAGDPKTIVDTGTQFYSMPTAAYQSLMNQADPGFTAVFGANTLGSIFGGPNSCVVPMGGQTQAQIDAALPPMTMTLPSVGGGSFTLHFAATASYLVPATPAGGGALQYCLAIKDSAKTGGFSLLGGPLMRANITLFDFTNSTLGFVPQSFCN
jgi:hypothetical protein